MPTVQRDYFRNQATRDAVHAAKERGGHQPLTLNAYCDATDCPAREVKVFVKDHDNELHDLLMKHGFRCPICHRVLKTHDVLTLEERYRHDDQLARMSVNAQLYKRATGSSFIPANVLMDDSLPEQS